MGLLSGLIGGGGGSSSGANTKVKVGVSPIINVTTDLTPVQNLVDQITGISSEQFKAIQETQGDADIATAAALDGFLDTLKEQQLLTFLAVGGLAFWVMNR